MTRNRTVHLASAEWMAFIDDDERAPPRWLRLMLESAARFQADGVLAPVEPQLPATAPPWIRRGKFYDWPHVPTGTVVPLKHLRFGNVLLRGRLMRDEPGPFDRAYGLSTGEDGDLLLRLIDKGARIVWCDEALVWEPIEPKRMSVRWLLQRSLSGGQQHARLAFQGRYRRSSATLRALLIPRWLGQLVIALVLAALSWPLGRHRAVAWLIKAWANLGKLSMLSRWRYSEYA
jgi:succinoglycan biosynthesis protein ExoM